MRASAACTSAVLPTAGRGGLKRRVVVFGLSVTSSWGNGHATTFRGLLRELAEFGHEVIFFERDVPWYASNRDLPDPTFCRLELYSSIEELRSKRALVADADYAIVGSYVPEGVAVGEWVLENARCPVAFYDIDTPVTLAKLERGDFEYLSPRLIPQYSQYLSFTGGPTLRLLERVYGSPCALPLYCSFDPELYYHEPGERRIDLGYMGTYSSDRQPPLERLMLDAARTWRRGSFLVAGPMYPSDIDWPTNVSRREHLPPCEHRSFYNAQRFTLNITRADMVKAGWSPSVRLFEAAACATPIISDTWHGLDDFFAIGEEILVSGCAEQTLHYLRKLSVAQAEDIGRRAQERVLARHTAARRAAELESYMELALAEHRAAV